ncbi:hypothetical protein HN51_021048, partial [Arachis hypogaea]
FAGINGVLYYSAQILEKAILLKDIGISSKSTSFLINDVKTLLMLLSIALAHRYLWKKARFFILFFFFGLLILIFPMETK